MDFPINIELNIAWAILIVSFIVLPLILLVFKRWWVVIVQTILIAVLSSFVAYLAFTNVSIDSKTLYAVLFYGIIGIYVSLGVYGIADGVYKTIKS